MTCATIAAPKPVTLPPSQDADSITDAVIADEKKCVRDHDGPLSYQVSVMCMANTAGWPQRVRAVLDEC